MSDVVVRAVAWFIIMSSFALFVLQHLRHRAWCREGDRLAAQFIALMDERERELDPRVMEKPTDPFIAAQLREDIDEFFARCDEHHEQRKRHLEAFRC